MSYELPRITVTGSAREMGRSHGEAVRDSIRPFVQQRLDAYVGYSSERGGPGLADFRDAGRSCLAAYEAWDPEGHAEHVGVAEGAGVDAADLYSTTNMTDVRDVVILPPSSDEGCSALVVPPSLTKHGVVLAGQTWDLNPQDLDYILAIHRKPSAGPQTWSVTCVGCPTLVGMNEHGLMLGTTNIKVRGSRVGVGYLSLLHRAVRERDRSAAARIIAEAPRAAAHTYWFADSDGGIELECSAERVVQRDLEGAAFSRTNHCFDETHVRGQGEAPNSSSYARLKMLEERLARGEHDVETIQELYADRSEGKDSINRYPEDETGTATNSCMVGIPADRKMWACKGPSDRGEWVELGFD